MAPTADDRTDLETLLRELSRDPLAAHITKKSWGTAAAKIQRLETWVKRLAKIAADWNAGTGDRAAKRALYAQFRRIQDLFRNLPPIPHNEMLHSTKIGPIESAGEEVLRVLRDQGLEPPTLEDIPIPDITLEVSDYQDIHRRLEEFSAKFTALEDQLSLFAARTEERRVNELAKKIQSLDAKLEPLLGAGLAERMASLTESIEKAERLREVGAEMARERTLSHYVRVFEAAATSHGAAAKPWWQRTLALAAVALAVPIAAFFGALLLTEPLDLLRLAFAAAAVFSIVVSSALWTSRMYRAERHLEVLNGHRARAIASFEAFHASAADLATKDALLIRASAAVFDVHHTGYSSQETTDGGPLQLVELIRQVNPLNRG